MRARWVALATLPVALAIVATAFLAHRQPMPSGSNAVHAMIDGQALTLDLATSTAQREQGLGGRAGLDPMQGMLFVFAKDGTYSFWMKDMRFSIDIVWLDAAGRIVFAAEDVAPQSYPAIITPRTKARYVLEVSAGYMRAHGISVGDTVTFTEPVPRSTE
jgi:uncharacterized membrane protein (UPF0127 family)